MDEISERKREVNDFNNVPPDPNVMMDQLRRSTSFFEIFRSKEFGFSSTVAAG